MATHRLDLLNALTTHGPSGDTYREPLSVLGNLHNFDPHLFMFHQEGVKIDLFGAFHVPKNYVATTNNIIIVWTATTTSGSVRWDFSYKSIGGSDAESMNIGSAQIDETASATAGGPTTALNRIETSIALSTSFFAVDDTVLWRLRRDDDHLADDMAAAAAVVELRFEYEDT